MGFFTAIGAGLSTIFGGSGGGADRAMEVIRGAGRWIDEQQYTAEEKAKALADLGDRVIEFVGATANESTERSITRRSIAIWIMRAEVCTLAASGIIYPFNSDWAAYLLAIANFDAPLGWLAIGVAVFFFGTHMLRANQGR